jgi:uncharacterized membrane protein YjgN (DUF898 family)
MEIISESPNSNEKELKYFGKGSEFAVIFFKNIILNFLTIGLYYPWAKVEQLKYFYQVTELNGSRFSFTGTGKEVFKGFIKVYLVFAILLTMFMIGSSTHNQTLLFVSLGLFYSIIILLIPFAIHGTLRYRSSRSAWSGIHFKYTGIRMEMFRLCLKGFLLTILTLGIYSSWFNVSIRKYALSHLKFGNLTFDFKGKGDELFWINLKLVLLMYITLGIYTIWYVQNLYKFYVENIRVYQNNNEVKFKLNITPGGIFGLVFTNFLLIIFTLGLATPWVTIRIFKYALENIIIEGDLDVENISQIGGDDYDDAAGDDFLDFLDIDLI